MKKTLLEDFADFERVKKKIKLELMSDNTPKTKYYNISNLLDVYDKCKHIRFHKILKDSSKD